MENVIYAAAVLASQCDDNANNPNVVASVVRALHEIDQRMLALVPTDDAILDERALVEQKALFDLADVQGDRLEKLNLSFNVYYNDELPADARSRFRIEITNTCWDCGAPLYLS